MILTLHYTNNMQQQRKEKKKIKHKLETLHDYRKHLTKLNTLSVYIYIYIYILEKIKTNKTKLPSPYDKSETLIFLILKYNTK